MGLLKFVGRLLTVVFTLQQGWAAEEFRPLFNGKDLSGWVNVNCAPNTFTVRDQMIISTGIPTGVMRTDRQYENFELELEWRHMKTGGNAGLFVWSDPLTSPGVPFAKSIEIQILDGRNSETYTSHGDVFAIHGASFKPDRPHPKGAMRCLPSEQRAKPAGEWNHYRVLCSNGVVKLAVNGKVVSGGSESKNRKGYICLESEGSECHFRNIRIRELPSSNAPLEETAPLAEPFLSLYTGLDLSGWKAEGPHWQSQDWILEYTGKGAGHLWTEKEYRDFILVCDWRWVNKGTNRMHQVMDDQGNEKGVQVMDAGESGIFLRGNTKNRVNIWCSPVGSGKVSLAATPPADIGRAATPRKKADKAIGQWNRFVITLKGEALKVELNGETIIENLRLPEIARQGPIGLEGKGAPIQFANIFVRQLN